MTTTEHLRAAERFAAEWAGKGDEKKDCQKFWLQLLGSVLGMGDAVYGEVEFEHHSRARDLKGFIDVRIPKSGVLIEQKSHDVDLVRDLTADAFCIRYESDLLEVSSTPRIRGRHLRAGRGRSNRCVWTAQAILDTRAKYPEASLADLYGEAMFLYPELVAAHRANDAAVCAAYGFPPDLPEPEIVSRLFALYQQLTTR